MRRGHARATLRNQAGFALIEVVVSALILATVTGGVVRLVSASGRTGAEERHRTQAYSIAQEDQARLRSTRVADLATAIAPRTVTLNGTPYEVTSTATFVSDKTGATSCGSEARADYVKLGSKVTWPSMRAGAIAAEIESIVSPVSGSLDPTAGNLSVTIKNASGAGISGAGINGSGPGSFSGSTDSNGCALFGGQPAGKYTVTPNLSSEYVDFNGEAPSATTLTITAGITTPLALEYDKKGMVQVNFTVRDPSGAIVPSWDDSVTATATGLTKTGGAKVFGTPFGSLENPVLATPLYPFTYTYNFYGGSCAANKPTEGSADVKAVAGKTETATVQLPALYLTVVNSSGTTAEKEGVSGARVTVTDTKCSSYKRVYTSTETSTGKGTLPNPGLSASTYDLCASKSISGTIRRVKMSGVPVTSLAGVSKTLNLSGAETGQACP